MTGPKTEAAQQLHADKYRGPGESFREATNRIANALKDSDEHFHEFRHAIGHQRFLPGGRVQSAIGSTKSVTAYNCFVSGVIEDSFVDGSGSIMKRAHEAAATMRMGGGIGYDFSTLRPRGATVRKLQSSSTGPVSFMEIFDAVCRCVASSGHRRGAQMGVMRVDHPDIEEFIRAKQVKGALEGFNVSVAITDEFMEALLTERPFALRFGGEVYREIDPAALWDIMMRGTYDWAEPGVIFVDRINEQNNLWYCEQIAATNPCGEQPLPPFGACLLGSFNLTKYLDVTTNGVDLERYFAWDSLEHDIPHVVRAMDNVIDRTVYPLYEQEKEAKQKRRMGLGVTGLANAAEVLGYPYGSPAFLAFERQVLHVITRESYRASARLAAEKGAFPLFQREPYLNGKFVQRLDEETLDLISKHGIRNSHLTSIAPTGTISMTADNVSSGVEPVFAHEVERRIRDANGFRTVKLQDWALASHDVRGRSASQVTVEEHLRVLATAQEYVDSAVSKTLNVPKEYPWGDFKRVYLDAWRLGAKGCTTYRTGGKREGILTEAEPAAACRIDEKTGRRECD
jgi:ribonucleoside-diphosphate reductase alpha chain